MPINNHELIHAVSMLADNANIRVAVNKSLKGACVCGSMAFIGGLLLGPPGLAIGGSLGGLSAYRMNSGSFQPVGEILMNLRDDQKEQLVRHVQAAIANVGVEDVALILSLLASNGDIQTAVLRTVTSFVKNELHLKIM